MARAERTEALIQIDRAMVRIRRSQARRTIGRLMRHRLGPTFNMAHGLVADALDELSGIGGEQPNVGAVAGALGIDPSRASRMVAGAVRTGYVKRVASQADGRSTCLELTDAGRQLLRNVRRFRTDFFSKLMATWSDVDCSEFARLLTRFTEALPQIGSKSVAQ
jgi:DNA-binding MarR family transcriptional regulator